MKNSEVEPSRTLSFKSVKILKDTKNVSKLRNRAIKIYIKIKTKVLNPVCRVTIVKGKRKI